MTSQLKEKYLVAYMQWQSEGGITNNFRAHLLATGICPPVPADLEFMRDHARIAMKQYEQVQAQLQPHKPATGKAADISYLTKDIDTAFIQGLQAMGIDLVIVGLQNPDLARRQLGILKNSGVKLQVYIYVPSKAVPGYLKVVDQVMIDYAIKTVWVDVEESDVNQNQALAWLTENTTYQVGVYTSAYMWSRWMNNTTRWSKLPLWYARYDDKQDMNDFEPFAGWTRPVMKQYNADNPRFDLNVYDVTAF